MTTFQEARAFLLEAPHRLRCGGEGISLARSGAVQLGAGLVRCGTGARSRKQGSHRRCGSSMPAATARPNSRSQTLSRRSNQVANFLRAQGLKRGDHLLLLLGNVVPLWETMLAAIKLGVVVIPATTLLTPDELRTGSIAAAPRPWWRRRTRSRNSPASAPTISSASSSAPRRSMRAGCRSSSPRSFRKPSRRTDRPRPTIRCCCISPRAPRQNQNWCGTASAAIPSAACRRCTGSGLQPGDVHLNISSPGWAKHAWSCFFAPWNAGATIFIVNQPRFEAKAIARDHRPLRRHDAVRAADGVAAVHPGEARRLQGQSCARSAAPASRSIPK